MNSLKLVQSPGRFNQFINDIFLNKPQVIYKHVFKQVVAKNEALL